MLPTLLRRLALLPPLLLAIYTITFALAWLAPGNPLQNPEGRRPPPEVAEAILAVGDADLISMARPLLADPDFARKVRADQPQAINTCIACNQACLDAIFTERSATCLVNPRAGREIDFVAPPPARAC